MNEISVSFVKRICFGIFGRQKGGASLGTLRRALAGLGASCLLLSLSGAADSGWMQPAAAKGQMENVNAPFQVMDEVQGKQTVHVIKMVVKAKPEHIFRILTDYENAPGVFPHLLKCHVLENHGSTKIVEHKVQPSGPFGTYTYVLQVKEVPGKSLEWHRIRGDFKEVDGLWKLDPLEGGRHTFVTYTSHINGGLFLPPILIKRQVHADMPGVMSALKSQAESMTQIAEQPGHVHHN